MAVKQCTAGALIVADIDAAWLRRVLRSLATVPPCCGCSAPSHPIACPRCACRYGVPAWAASRFEEVFRRELADQIEAQVGCRICCPRRLC